MVSSLSTARKVYGGWMNSLVSPVPACTRPASSPTVSSVRTTVVPTAHTAPPAARAALIAAAEGAVRPGAGWTSLFIRPGHTFRVVDRMLTNFHLPRSTLLMLVSAFAGRELVMRAYEEAIRQRYRFYSYGDAMLIL